MAKKPATKQEIAALKVAVQEAKGTHKDAITEGKPYVKAIATAAKILEKAQAAYDKAMGTLGGACSAKACEAAGAHIA